MKRIIPLLLALTLALLLGACGKPKAPDTPNPPVDPDVPQSAVPDVVPDVPPSAPSAVDPIPSQPGASAPVEVIAKTLDSELADDDGEAVLRYSLKYPHIPALPAVSDYYENRTQELAQQCAALLDEAKTARADAADSGYFEPYAFDLDYFIQRNDGKVLSVQESVYQATNGPHPNTVYSANTFSTETQGRLLLADLFKVPEEEYLPRLMERVRLQMDEAEQTYGSFYYDNARDDLEQLFDTGDFYLTDDALVLFFNTYTLAPHAGGPQFFELPLTELSDILESWLTA